MAIWNILQHPKFTGQRAHSFYLTDFSCSTSWSVSLQISWEVFYLGQLWVFDYLHPEHLASYLIHHEKTPSLRWRGHNRDHWKWARSVNGAHLACLHILTILAINPSETPRIVCTVVLVSKRISSETWVGPASWVNDNIVPREGNVCLSGGV